MLRRVFVCFAVALCSAVFVSAASAQVIYQPLQYQHQADRYGAVYYYGGTNPAVHQQASFSGLCRPYYYAMNLHRFDGGNSFGQPSPFYNRSAIYTDCVPYQDVSRQGWSAIDAHNEARLNTPTYFRKADLLASAVPQPDGSWVVPFHAPTVTTTRYATPTHMHGVSVMPAKKGQILIIPRRLLDKKVKDLEAKPTKVATAN